MNEELIKTQKNVTQLPPETIDESISLYPGIRLCEFSLPSGSFSLRQKALPHIIQINYCRAGQLLWEMNSGSRICLNPGDLSLHSMSVSTDSVLTVPESRYQGLAICIDLQEASDHPPELLRDSHVFDLLLPQRLCRAEGPVFLAGNEQTERIFSAFYGQPKTLKLSYQKIKTLELLLFLAKTELFSDQCLSECREEQLRIARKVHDYLTRNMEKRITIEELSRQYLINPTTLKNTFKAIYGTSIAAHIKEHRMEEAARLLKETDDSIAKIAQVVGYDSQSRFAAAFKSYFQALPREYRKRYSDRKRKEEHF